MASSWIHNDFVYISGNGQDFTGQFPWAATYGDDSHILKFTAEGEFIYQIGHAGMEGPDSENINGGPDGTPQPYLVADMSVDPATNRMFVADGYGNRRVLIVDAETGQYVGHFGAYGQNPVDDPEGTDIDPYDAGPWAGDYQAGNMTPMFFRSPLHCADLSADGLLYVCDRGNNRIQVFDVNSVGEPVQQSERGTRHVRLRRGHSYRSLHCQWYCGVGGSLDRSRRNLPVRGGSGQRHVLYRQPGELHRAGSDRQVRPADW